MKVLLLALALPLAAEDHVKVCSPKWVTDHTEEVCYVSPVDVDALKARIAYLEQRLALTEQKCTALANFYAAQQALDQQKPPEPPKDEKK